MSSNGGTLLLREAGRSRGLSALSASCIADARDPSRVVHSFEAVIQARMVAIACGHEDCDDLDILRHDPALKIACDKRPDAQIALASQPTLSRLENAVDWRMLARMGLGMIDAFCDSYARVTDRILLDFDDTVDLAHGGQQLSLFNTHAGDTCLPADPDFRGRNRETRCCELAPRQAPLERGGRQSDRACRPAYPQQLAARGDYAARRRALWHSTGDGHALTLPPTTPPAIDGKPTSSGFFCTPPLTG